MEIKCFKCPDGILTETLQNYYCEYSKRTLYNIPHLICNKCGEVCYSAAAMKLIRKQMFNKRRKCYSCDSGFIDEVIKDYYKTLDNGEIVKVENISMLVCDNCGDEFLSHDSIVLINRILERREYGN